MYTTGFFSGSTEMMNLGTANFTNNQNMDSDVKLPSFAKAVEELPLNYFFDYDDVKLVYLMFKGAGQRTLPPRDVVWAILRARLSTTMAYQTHSRAGESVVKAWTRRIYLEKLRLETTWTEYEKETASWLYMISLLNQMRGLPTGPWYRGGKEHGMEMRWSKDGKVAGGAIYGPSFSCQIKD